MKPGVKSNISDEDRLLIGARYEADASKLSEAAALLKHKGALPYADIEKSRAELIELRKAGKEGSEDADEHLAWISEMLDGGRLVSFKAAQGVHKALEKQIAKEASEQLGITITPRQVRRCRDEYRLWCKKQRGEI